MSNNLIDDLAKDFTKASEERVDHQMVSELGKLFQKMKEDGIVIKFPVYENIGRKYEWSFSYDTSEHDKKIREEMTQAFLAWMMSIEV